MLNVQRNPQTGKIIAKYPTLKWAERVISGDNSTGWCLACGEERDSCEPDARSYHCDACGHNTVYGAEELVMAGRVR